MKYDVAIIGGGPAGMMAARKAGSLEKRVILLEKNNQLGVKLLITGGGRCNLTNNLYPSQAMTKQYGKNGKFLISSLTNFTVDETISFFNKNGVATKIEEEGKVFPLNDKSSAVLDVLIREMEKNKVKIKLNTEVKKIIQRDGKVKKIILTDNQEVIADKYILTTGGKSYPETGSTGDGLKWAQDLGHSIIKTLPSLCAVITKGSIAKSLQGLSLKNVSVKIIKNKKKIKECSGDVIFTNNGLSGPAIFNISKDIAKEFPAQIKLELDFFPDKNHQELDKMFLNLFSTNKNKLLKNNLDTLLPNKLIPIVIDLCKINSQKATNGITKEERKKIFNLLKCFCFEIEDLTGFKKAIITSGGINLKEINPKTMQSKIIKNLFFAGEILDLDGPTGGYNLQICWSTGVAAGQ